MDQSVSGVQHTQHNNNRMKISYTNLESKALIPFNDNVTLKCVKHPLLKKLKAKKTAEYRIKLAMAVALLVAALMAIWVIVGLYRDYMAMKPFVYCSNGFAASLLENPRARVSDFCKEDSVCVWTKSSVRAKCVSSPAVALGDYYNNTDVIKCYPTDRPDSTELSTLTLNNHPSLCDEMVRLNMLSTKRYCKNIKLTTKDGKMHAIVVNGVTVDRLKNLKPEELTKLKGLSIDIDAEGDDDDMSGSGDYDGYSNRVPKDPKTKDISQQDAKTIVNDIMARVKPLSVKRTEKGTLQLANELDGAKFDQLLAKIHAVILDMLDSNDVVTVDSDGRGAMAPLF
ncbi:hypothetical protein [Crucian carp herpesvirus]|uniref:ORF1 n=1 Tax=Cyprinid herpesvirus 2 TaxID=317878 RepID=A0A0E3T4U9_CYHV2|nr:hypothetical protein [Cyprinid herpesvirus 2]AMB21729.1 ORF1 [Cyprinid herpesvirus 2]APB92854.1 hypothetical protein [Crucian carp herpesvirus]QAU54881.1 protein ORF1 [Cyprinid herpesvirus 2]QIM55337.1 hypothetical protein [Cyprinid herpesvirus 2]